MTRSAARLFRLDPGPSGLALCCDETGLSLAGVALLRKTEAGFEPRSPEELDLLLKSAGADGEPSFALSSSGLASVAEALNRGDLAKAQMKALFLHAPKLDAAAAARLAEADEALAKGGPSNAYLYEDRNAQGRWIHGGGGGAGPVGEDKARSDGLRGPLSPPHFPAPAAPKPQLQSSPAPAPQGVSPLRPPHGRLTWRDGVFSYTAHRTTPLSSPRLEALVDAQNAAMVNPAWQPKDNGHLTFCNFATAAIAKKMGASFPGLYTTGNSPNMANGMATSLGASGSGYHTVTPDQAQSLANKGVVVFGSQIISKHGHIVTVRPQGVPNDDPVVSSYNAKHGIPDSNLPILANVGYFNGVSHAHVSMDPKNGKVLYYAPDR